MNIKTSVKKFNDQEVTFIDKDNQIWVTAEELGKALGYSNDHRRRVMHIYSRHKDILDLHKGVLNLSTPGGMQEVTVFDEVGANLIAMKSTTKRAKAFQIWLAHVAKEFRHGNLVSKGDNKDEIMSYIHESIYLNIMQLKFFYRLGCLSKNDLADYFHGWFTLDDFSTPPVTKSTKPSRT